MPQTRLVYVAAALLVASLATSCARSDAFETELRRVRGALGGDRVTGQSRPDASGYGSVAYWQYQVIGDVAGVASDVARRVPKDYRQVEQSAGILEFARREGDDDYYLSLALSAAGPGQTSVSATLRCLPD